ncbi:MAG: hypothetical protein ACKESB_00360 [Candidatus Hodgkinia cicadicola]
MSGDVLMLRNRSRDASLIGLYAVVAGTTDAVVAACVEVYQNAAVWLG